jgi:hypothetical protein
MAGRKADRSAMAEIVRVMEAVPFRQARVCRSGFEDRKVKAAQRMIGHVGVLDHAASVMQLELDLSLDWVVVHALIAYHDLYKFERDAARVRKPKVGKPSGKWKMRAKKAMKAGRTFKERRKEYDTAITQLEPKYRNLKLGRG